MNTNLLTEPWTIDSGDFPHGASTSKKIKFMLRYATMAPSSHNSQPWRFRIRDNEVELYADKSRALPVVDPDCRQMIMGCGAALQHLRISMLHFGYLGTVAYFPDDGDPDLLARVTLGYRQDSTLANQLLFNAIPKRRTNRQPFSADPVPDALLRALEDAALHEWAWLKVVRDEDARFELADLIAEGDRRQWANRHFRAELAVWLHPNRGESRDGIPGYAQSADSLLSSAGPLIVRSFDMGTGQAARDRDIALFSPILAVLGTPGDSPADWLAAGQALARVLLRARVEDVWASFLCQPVEIPELRQMITPIIRHPGSPQLILRMGFGVDVRPTPRRPVEEVVI
jgi:hypothetical protein